MSTADEIYCLQQEIWALQAQQKKLREKEKAEKLEEIRSLGWLKGKTVLFQKNPYAGAGIPTYTLTLVGKVDLIEGITGFGGSLGLYGEHKLYEYNITLRSGDCWGSRIYTMETSSIDTLMKFIDAADLRFKMEPKDVMLQRIILDRLVDPGQ